MNRTALSKLIEWKELRYRKPLVIKGARQVGKTWLMKEFGRQHYASAAYVNFEGNERMKRLFSSDLDTVRLLKGIELETGVAIHPESTLLIFDEVQEVPRALTSLKYFSEQRPDIHLVAAGSLIGVALHPETSFPVGKVDFLTLHPLTFEEFLVAAGHGDHMDLIRQRDWNAVATFKDRFTEWLRNYFIVGGMPEVVSTFLMRADHADVRRVQERILAAYEQDFSKHAPPHEVPRIRQLWQSIPAQLARENRKFVYGVARAGARAREYELALAWLLDSGLIHKVHAATKPGLPLAAYQDSHAFKLFALDVGLLAAMSRLDARVLLDGDRLFEEFKGALTEQYVHQQLVARDDAAIFYWSADRGLAEVDFIIQRGDQILPIEVKAGENLRSKSLRVYRDKFQPTLCVRTSLSDYRQEEWLTNLPLYGISAI